MTDCDALLAGIVADPLEETRWLVLADWLEEFDDPRRAELLRLHRRMLATCCEPDAHPERAAWQSRMTELLVAGVRPCVPQETLTLPGGVPMTFSFIPPGAFLMGSEKLSNVEGPVHRVEVRRGFFMGISPVTQAQWFAVMGTDPSHFKGAVRPVEQVSWNDCQEFCAKLSQLTVRQAELPTEAEWEYTCRGGTTTAYHFGDLINTDLVNYSGMASHLRSREGQYREQTTDVGSFSANPWGLFDVHGNVLEWCADVFGMDTVSTPDYNQEQLDTYPRVQRGGGWANSSRSCHAASRWGARPSFLYSTYGFRVCLRLS